MKNAWGDDIEEASAVTAKVNAWGDPIEDTPQGSGGILGGLKDLAAYAGRQIDRVSAGPLRGAEEGIQDYQPTQDGGFHPGGVLMAGLKGAGRGFMNPDQVQPGRQMFARMGVSDAPSSQLNVMGTSGQPMNLGQDRPAGDPSLAATLGAAQDMLAPLPPVGLALKGAGKALEGAAGKLSPMAEKAAERIQQTVIKPRVGDWNAGAKIENVKKYGIQGNINEVINGADAQIKDAATQLRQAITEGRDGGASVDLHAAIDAAKAKLEKEGGADLVDAMGPAFSKFNRWADIEAARGGLAQSGKADLLQAQEFKQMMGTHGAWEKTAAAKNMGISEAERYQSRAAQAVYLQLKDAVEAAAPEGVRDLNKTLSDLIPIRNAAVYRKIVSDRNNPIGLSDMMSAMTAIGNGPAGAAMLAATRFTKSGFGAKKMYAIADNLKKLSAATKPGEAAFYADKLRKAGLTDQDIKDASDFGFNNSDLPGPSTGFESMRQPPELPARQPQGSVSSNFPPPLVETPKVQAVLDAVPGRRQIVQPPSDGLPPRQSSYSYPARRPLSPIAPDPSLDVGELGKVLDADAAKEIASTQYQSDRLKVLWKKVQEAKNPKQRTALMNLIRSVHKSTPSK